MQRWIEERGQQEPAENEFYSSFSYYPVKGLPYEEGVSRRDPSTIIKVDDTYYVYYTRTPKGAKPVGYKKADKTKPANTWDMASIYYATSKDGETWAGPGPCERNEDGTCQWTFVRCPEEQ